MKFINHSKGLTAALSIGCAMSIAVQSTLAYILAQTDPTYNTFKPYIPVEGDLLISKDVQHPYGEDYIIPDNISFDFQVDLGGFYADYTFSTSKGDIKADENGILSLELKPNESIAISGIEDGSTAKITEIQQDSDGFELDGDETKSVTISAEKLNEIEFLNIYTPEAVSADMTVTAEKLLDGRDWQEGDSFEFLFEREISEEWVKLDSAVVEYGGDTTADFTEAMKAIEFTELGDYLFRLTETEGDIENITYDDTENTFKVSVTDKDMDGYLEISEITAENNAVLTKGENGTYEIDVTFTNIYEPPVTTETTTSTKPTTSTTSTTKATTSSTSTTKATTTSTSITKATTSSTSTTKATTSSTSTTKATTSSTSTTKATTSTSTTKATTSSTSTTKATTTSSTSTTKATTSSTSTTKATTSSTSTTKATTSSTSTTKATTSSTSTTKATTSSTSTTKATTSSTSTTTKPTTTVADGAVTWDIEDKSIPYSDSDQTVTVAVVITNGEKPLPVAGGKFTIVTADGIILEAVTGSDAYGGDIFGDDIFDEFAFTNADGKGVAPADGTKAFELTITIPGGTDSGRYDIDISNCTIYDENGNDITDKLTIMGGAITVLPRVTTDATPTTTEPTTTTSTTTTTTTKPTTTTSTSTTTTTEPTTTTSTTTTTTTKPTTTTSTSTTTTTKPTTTTSTTTTTTTKPTTTVADGAVTWDIEDKSIPYSDSDQTVTVAVVITNGEKPLPVAGGKFTIVTADGIILEAVTGSDAYGGDIFGDDIFDEFAFTNADGKGVAPADGTKAFELTITIPGGTDSGRYDIDISNCTIYDENGNDITDKLTIMGGAITVLPRVTTDATPTTTEPTTTTSTTTTTTTKPTTTTSTSTTTTTEPTTTTSTTTTTTTKPTTTTSTSTTTTTKPTTTTSTTTTTTTTTKPTTTVADGAVTWDIEDKSIPYSDSDQTVTVAVVITNGEKPLPVAGGKFTIVTADGIILEAVTGSDAYGGDIFGDDIFDEFAFTNADGKGVAPADGTKAFELTITIPGGTDSSRYDIDISNCTIYDENGNDITDKLTIMGGAITVLPRVTTDVTPTTTEPTTTASTTTTTTTKPITTTSTSTTTTTEPITTTSTTTTTTTKPTTTTSTTTTTTTKPTTTTSTTTTSTSTTTTTKPTTTTSTSTTTTTKPTTTITGAVTWDIEDKNVAYSDEDQTVTVAVVIKNGEAPLAVSGGKFTIVTADGIILEAVVSSTGYGGTVTENESGEFTFTTEDGCNVTPENGELAFELVIKVPGGTEPGEYNISIGDCQVFDEEGNDISDRVAVMDGSITILPTVEPVINSYIVIEKPELGNYFSHDNRTYDKSKLGKVYRVFVDENGEEINREDITDDIDFNGNTPADTYRISNTSFRYEVPIYLEGELMKNEDGEIATAVAYIGVKGDVNLDNHANAIDATLILAYYAKMQTGESSETTILRHDDPYLDNLGAFLGDVDTNEYSPMNQATHKSVRKLDASDTSFILSYYAVTQTSYDPIPREIWKQVVGVDNIIDED